MLFPIKAYCSVEKTEPVNDDMKTRVNDGISVSPILGYNPTYGGLFGLAFFRGDAETPVSYLDSRLYSTLKQSHSLETTFTVWGRENTFYRFEMESLRS